MAPCSVPRPTPCSDAQRGRACAGWAYTQRGRTRWQARPVPRDREPVHLLTCTSGSVGCLRAASRATATRSLESTAPRSGGTDASPASASSAADAAEALPGPNSFAPSTMRAASALSPEAPAAGSDPEPAAGDPEPAAGRAKRAASLASSSHIWVNCARAGAPRMWRTGDGNGPDCGYGGEDCSSETAWWDKRVYPQGARVTGGETRSGYITRTRTRPRSKLAGSILGAGAGEVRSVRRLAHIGPTLASARQHSVRNFRKHQAFIYYNIP